MSTPERRKELAAIHEREDAARRAEEHRRASLSMYARIEELDEGSELKEVLHAMAERLGHGPGGLTCLAASYVSRTNARMRWAARATAPPSAVLPASSQLPVSPYS